MRTILRSTRGRATVCGAVAGALLLATGVPAPAAVLTTPACLAKKLKEWANFRKCQAMENGKVLQGKPADFAKCQARFNLKFAHLNALAAGAAIPCRYSVNADGTATDYDTGLQWERKTTDNGVHDRGKQHTWSTSGTAPDGTAFTDFLGTLNNAVSSDGITTGGCFAGHCDWRLPAIGELMSIVDLGAPGCGSGNPCIDEATFGPTLSSFVMSGSTDAGGTTLEFVVYFFNGELGETLKVNPMFVRAVRSAM